MVAATSSIVGCDNQVIIIIIDAVMTLLLLLS